MVVAIDGAAAGAASAAVTGTSGAEGGAGAGALATAGAEGGASAGAVATAGWACEPLPLVSDAAADGGVPGTPPVTLIESPLESSLLAGWGTDAAGGAEFAGSLRIESPTVPEPIAGPESGDDLGALTPS